MLVRCMWCRVVCQVMCRLVSVAPWQLAVWAAEHTTSVNPVSTQAHAEPPPAAAAAATAAFSSAMMLSLIVQRYATK